MKYITIYENFSPWKKGHLIDLFSQSKFKVGDYVRCKDNLGLFEIELEPGTNYFEILKISDNEMDHSLYKCLLHNIVDTTIMDFFDAEDNLELVPDYEINAIKYNL